VGSPQPTKPQPPSKRPKLEQISKKKDVFGDVSDWHFVRLRSNTQKSESEMSVLIDDEPPKRRRKSKGEKGETVRVTPQLSLLRMNFDDPILI